MQKMNPSKVDVPRPRYTLNELLAQCDPKPRRTKEEREWLADKPAGRELI